MMTSLRLILLVSSLISLSATTAHSKVVAHWSFDEPSEANRYADVANNQHTLAPQTPPDHITTGQRFGNGALAFDQEKKQSLILEGSPSGGALGLENKSFTISFWAKRNSLGEHWILGQSNTKEMEKPYTRKVLHIGFRGKKNAKNDHPHQMTLAFYKNDLSAEITPLDTLEWHHYVLIYDAELKEQRIIINGNTAEATVRSHSDSFEGGGENDFYVGCRYSNDGWFDGMLDELWVFEGVLQNEQIQTLYTDNRYIDGEIAEDIVYIPEPKAFSLVLSLLAVAYSLAFQRRMR